MTAIIGQALADAEKQHSLASGQATPSSPVGPSLEHGELPAYSQHSDDSAHNTSVREEAQEPLFHAQLRHAQTPPRDQAAAAETSSLNQADTTSRSAGCNRCGNGLSAESWWMSRAEKECFKAARTLHSFTGLSSESAPAINGFTLLTNSTKKPPVKIPPAVLQQCAGLAIFKVVRAGACHNSLAIGSGLVVARRPDGTWSPPAGFVVSTLGAGFVFGLEVYECVCVLNTQEQVQAFTKPRLSLGGAMSIAVGPVGTGAAVDAAIGKTARPMWSYMKSKGLWAGIQVDGTVMISRAKANARFYGERGITAEKILTDSSVEWPAQANALHQVLMAIDGWTDHHQGVSQAARQTMPPAGLWLPDDEKTQSASTRGGQTEPVETEKQPADESILDEKERLKRSGY